MWSANDDNDGPPVIGVAQGGPIQYGEAIRFDLQLADNSVRSFHCRYERMQWIILGLTTAARATEEYRRGHLVTPGNLGLSQPFRVSQVRTGLSDGQIVVQVTTEQGMPLDLAFSQATAQTLLQALAHELGKTPGDASPETH